MKHTRLTKHRPLLYVAVENVSLALDFACGIFVVSAGYQRIAHSPPWVLVVAVAVYRNSGNMHEFGLIFLYLGHRIHDIYCTYAVTSVRKHRIMVGSRRNDCGEIENVIAVCHEFSTIFDFSYVAENYFDFVSVFAIPFLCTLASSSFVQKQYFKFFDNLALHELHDSFKSHISACACDRNDFSHICASFGLHIYYRTEHWQKS